jgi:putative heme iron utilization protein
MLKSTRNTLLGLLENERILALAVVADEVPVATLVPFLFRPVDRAVMINASKLSLHSRGLVDGGRVGIVVHEQDAPDKDPLQLKRISFQCRVEAVERESEIWTEVRDRFLERYPSSRMTFKLRDFTMYRLVLEQGRYFGGFGRAVEIEPEDIVALTAG